MEYTPLEFVPHPQFSEQAKFFYEAYELIDLIGNDDERYSKRSLKPFDNRVCMFCGRAYPDARFSNYSHLLPQLMGNRNLYSGFECDSCNEKFSVIENDLAEFLGVSRSFTGLASEKMTPGFKAKRLHAKSRSFLGNNILIVAPQDIQRVEDCITILYEKNAFFPANVYKALLKSTLSLLGDEIVKSYYKKALDYLVGKSMITKGAFIAGYKLSFGINLPLHACVFRKRRKEDKIFTHVIIFNFQNNIISFPLPFHKDDFSYSNQNINSLLAPPYFTNKKYLEVARPVAFVRDMSSPFKITDEEESITVVYDHREMEQMHSYNPETGEIKRHKQGPADIKYLIVTKDGASFDPKELSSFIKSQTAMKKA